MITKTTMKYLIMMEIINLEYDPIFKMRNRIMTGVFILQGLSLLLIFFPSMRHAHVPMLLSLLALLMTFITISGTTIGLNLARRKGKRIEKMLDILLELKMEEN